MRIVRLKVNTGDHGIIKRYRFGVSVAYRKFGNAKYLKSDLYTHLASKMLNLSTETGESSERANYLHVKPT